MDSPAAEFRNDERVQLITKSQQLLAGRRIERVPLSIWACMWLSDLEVLRATTQKIENNDTLIALFSNPTVIVDTVIKPWMRRRRDSDSLLDSGTSVTSSGAAAQAFRATSSPHRHKEPANDINSPAKKHKRTGSSVQQGLNVSGASTPKRLESMKGLAASRDKQSCLLTLAGCPLEVAHIYPFSMYEYSEHDIFWATLQYFWSTERIARWKKALFTEARTEVCENLMTMCPNAHAYWGKSYFALKPLKVSEDNKEITVKFFWLRKHEGPNSIPVGDAPVLPANLHGVNNVKLFDTKSEKLIRSGKVFCFTTDDLIKKPLPSKDILDMQWVLHRLTALSGGAELINYTYNPDDPNDYHPCAALNDTEWFDDIELLDELDTDPTPDSPQHFADELSRRLSPYAASAALYYQCQRLVDES
ncbi:hypothetical protein F5884DRAFT_750637 [Xylogone sp. PMI_703]|nr:hypothetical protein F5884DRAFT_750637 [Xylogone sp. PMI_703]